MFLTLTLEDEGSRDEVPVHRLQGLDNLEEGEDPETQRQTDKRGPYGFQRLQLSNSMPRLRPSSSTLGPTQHTDAPYRRLLRPARELFAFILG